ncbi:hypothetical protein MMC34_003447 [Xylographa carneopallida]|nr:hypothetical protein [Xylographa carneopallida]
MVLLQCIPTLAKCDIGLETLLEEEQKKLLIHCLFNVDKSTVTDSTYQPFFENYGTQLLSFNLGAGSDKLTAPERDTRLRPYIVAAVAKLFAEPRSLRESVKEHVKQIEQEHSDVFLDRAIDLALQVWLMINSRDRTNDTSPTSKWIGDQSLDHLVKDLFPVEDEQTDLRFTYRFTAANIERYSGVKIVWTRYLSEHLSFDDEEDYRKLKIFPYKQWLKDMLELAKVQRPPIMEKACEHDESGTDSVNPEKPDERPTMNAEHTSKKSSTVNRSSSNQSSTQDANKTTVPSM